MGGGNGVVLIDLQVSATTVFLLQCSGQSFNVTRVGLLASLLLYLELKLESQNT